MWQYDSIAHVMVWITALAYRIITTHTICDVLYIHNGIHIQSIELAIVIDKLWYIYIYIYVFEWVYTYDIHLDVNVMTLSINSNNSEHECFNSSIGNSYKSVTYV